MFLLSLKFQHDYIDLNISNLEPKFNETITVSALNVPNFTTINLDNGNYNCNLILFFILKTKIIFKFILFEDFDNGGSYGFKRYTNSYTEQFILLVSQEIQQDSILKSVEFPFNIAGIIKLLVN